MVNAGERGEGVPLAGRVGFRLEEGTDELRGVGDKRRRVLEDGCDGKDCVLTNVRVTVLEALPGGGQQRLDKLGLPQLGEEAQGVASDVLVGVLEVISDTVADQDHFLLQLSAGVELGADLIVEIKHLLEGLRLGGHDEANDVHEQLGHRVAIEHDGEDALHGLNLALIGTLLELRPQVGQGRDIGSIVLVDQAVGVFEEARHGGGVMRADAGAHDSRVLRRRRTCSQGGEPEGQSRGGIRPLCKAVGCSCYSVIEGGRIWESYPPA